VSRPRAAERVGDVLIVHGLAQNAGFVGMAPLRIAAKTRCR
jgi:hypothetical protein